MASVRDGVARLGRGGGNGGFVGFLASARRPRLRFGLEFCHRLIGREDRHSMEVL